MKKFFVFMTLSFFCFTFVSADLWPSYPNRNKLNVADYTELTFFQKMRGEPQVWGLGIIPNNGIFESQGCPIEIWAIKDDSKLNDLTETIYIYDYSLLERWAIKLIQEIDCDLLFDGKAGEINYITITSDLFRNNNLSTKKWEELKTIVKNSYEKFKENIPSYNLREANIEISSKAYVLLRKEKRLTVIFALSYLRFLTSNSRYR
jgi:hypothetical protein